jgi:hypothetical protein
LVGVVGRRCRSRVLEKRPGGGGALGGGGGGYSDSCFVEEWVWEGGRVLVTITRVRGTLLVWAAAGGVSRMPYGVAP